METKPSGMLVYVATGAMLALTGANGFLFWRTSAMEAEISKMNSTHSQSAGQLMERNEAIKAELQKNLTDLNQQLEETRAKASSAAVNAKVAAVKHADKIVQSIAEENRRDQEKVTQEIVAVKAVAEANQTKVSEVSTEVGSVKADVVSARAELDKTIAGLSTMRGDLGVQSGLIATNSTELAALRELGERNYTEFTITKASKLYKIGNIALVLKKADPKRNKYNIEVAADDKRVEKKDRTINEPVQFYVTGARQPYELVVNQVSKDKIVGYLATPKMIRAAR